MPRLKQLEIQGFKSFADPCTLHFPTGITAIVGPNGSGKSNIADAIRWVLGEKRMTSIRGRTGEDMIFAGSRKRARAGMARASIVFDNSDGWIPVDFAEVTIERRTYRDGTSDYFLNGSKVRLTDLLDLLSRAGLGRDGYLVIGQGLVDQVLSLRPQERLALFEEAAGIAPYRKRRDDALLRLEETRTNLQRLYDIIGEIEPRLRRLRRQAARAEEHARLERELHETLRIWYGYRWGQATEAVIEAQHRVSYREDRALSMLERVSEVEQEVVQKRQLLSQQRTRLAELHRLESARHREAEDIQRELAVAEERQRQLAMRLNEGESALIPLQTALEAELAELSATQQTLEDGLEKIAAAQAQLDELRASHVSWTERRRATLERQRSLQSRVLQVQRELADRTGALEQTLRRIEELQGQRQAFQTALERASAEHQQHQQDVERLRGAVAAARQRVQEMQTAEQEAREAISSLRTQYDAAQQALAQQERALQQAAIRLEALQRLHDEGEGLFAGVRAVLRATHRGELTGLPGTISTLVQVPQELELAIETALGSQLQNVVAESWRHAQEAVAWLKEHRAGRATFLPLDTLRPSSPLSLPHMEGVLGVAADLIEVEPRYQAAVRLLLGRTAVVQDLEVAHALYRRLRGSFRIVTLDGEIVRSGGSLTGGQSRQSRRGSLLGQERERRELAQRVVRLQRELDSAGKAANEARQRLEQAEEAMANARYERLAAEETLRQAEAELEREERTLQRLSEQQETRAAELAALDEELRQRQALRATLESEIATHTEELHSLEKALEELSESLQALDGDEVPRHFSEARTTLAILEQEQTSRRAMLETHRREIARLQRQIAHQEERLQALRKESAALELRLGELRTAYEEAKTQAEAVEAEIPPLENTLRALEEELEQLEQEENRARQGLREAERLLSEAEVELNRREDQLQALRHEIESTLDIVISNLPEGFSTQQPLPLEEIASSLPVVTALPQGLEDQVRDLRTQIRRLEPVNMAAQAEYAELAERHAFLESQTADLERASKHLREIVQELDQMMDTTFDTSFKAIAGEFARVFEMLFNGGQASLELLVEDGARVGVEISARPPGKRTASLSLLSGGERSLTAVALIFAIMRSSPVPFCVLDEVDAMLDEANVGRFRSMLQEMANDTQFILITHNKTTVEVADTIYGVSMGGDGVSQVLSLSLESVPTAANAP